MDGMYIIHNHKTMHVKPFSPKTKPWTYFQDLYVLGDFSNPKKQKFSWWFFKPKKQKWQDHYFLASRCVCEVQNKTQTLTKIPHLAEPPLRNKTPKFLFLNPLFIHASKTFLHTYLSQLLIHLFQHLKRQKINIFSMKNNLNSNFIHASKTLFLHILFNFWFTIFQHFEKTKDKHILNEAIIWHT